MFVISLPVGSDRWQHIRRTSRGRCIPNTDSSFCQPACSKRTSLKGWILLLGSVFLSQAWYFLPFFFTPVFTKPFSRTRASSRPRDYSFICFFPKPFAVQLDKQPFHSALNPFCITWAHATSGEVYCGTRWCLYIFFASPIRVVRFKPFFGHYEAHFVVWEKYQNVLRTGNNVSGVISCKKSFLTLTFKCLQPYNLVPSIMLQFRSSFVIL